MKKILAAVTAFILCGTMLTACVSKSGDVNAKDEPETTPAAAVTEAPATTAAETTTTEAATTTTAAPETEAEPAAEVLSFASLQEFADANPLELSGEPSTKENSNFTAISNAIIKDEKVYLDMEAIDKSISITMAFAMPLDLYIKVDGSAPDSGEAVNMIIMLKDATIYMLDGASKTGMYFAAPEGEDGLDGLGLSDSFSELIDIKDGGAEDLKYRDVEIDGKLYTFEFNDDMGFLFDGGKPYAVITEDSGSLPSNIFVINDFSANVPGGIFEVPSGYELTDMSSLFAGLAED